MKVLFVGSNPSSSSPDGSAFHPSCRSRKTIESWISGLECDARYENVSNVKTPQNRPLSLREIKDALPDLSSRLSAYEGFKIVAVGAAANKALQTLGVHNFMHIPHPSGRTRVYNDPLVKAATINALILFIKGYNINTGV